jgi:hypothetical protein
VEGKALVYNNLCYQSNLNYGLFLDLLDCDKEGSMTYRMDRNVLLWYISNKERKEEIFLSICNQSTTENILLYGAKSNARNGLVLLSI